MEIQKPNLNTTEYPLNLTSSLVIACICDQGYITHLKTLLRSLRSSNNNLSVALCLINLNNPKIKKKLISIYPDITFFHIERNFITPHEKKAFCANYRVIFLKNLLELCSKNLIYMDVDSIVRNKIDPSIFKNEDDILIHFRDDNDLRFKVAAGIIFIKNNLKAKRFMDEWEKRILPQMNEWFSDQITFHETYDAVKEHLNINHLSSEYIDWEFKQESAIWVGKGPRKYKNVLYLLERFRVKRYSLRLNNLIFKLQALLRNI